MHLDSKFSEEVNTANQTAFFPSVHAGSNSGIIININNNNIIIIVFFPSFVLRLPHYPRRRAFSRGLFLTTVLIIAITLCFLSISAGLNFLYCGFKTWDLFPLIFPIFC